MIDASDPAHTIHEDVVSGIMKELGMSDIPVLAVYNKLDLAENFAPTVLPNIQISIKNETGVAVLRQAIIDKIKTLFVSFDMTIPYSEAYRIPMLKKVAIIESIIAQDEDEIYQLSGYISEKEKWRITKNELY